MELFCISGAIVGWDTHTDQQGLRAGSLRLRQHRCEIVAAPGPTVGRATVIAAEFENDDVWLVQLQGARQAWSRTARRFAADAGVHYAVTVPLFNQSTLQQCDPGRIDGHAVTCAETVTQHQNHRLRLRCRTCGKTPGPAPARTSDSAAVINNRRNQ